MIKHLKLGFKMAVLVKNNQEIINFKLKNI